MFDMETGVQEIVDCYQSQEQATRAIAMGTEVRDSSEESQQERAGKASEKIAAYRKHKSAKLAAKECGVTESRMREVLTAERDRRGLSDIRLLYADSEDGFNRGSGEDVTASQLLELAESQSFRCALSGIALEPYSAALDHIVPVSAGGSHEIDNLQWLDRRINSMKGDMPVDEFVELCRAVATNARMALVGGAGFSGPY